MMDENIFDKLQEMGGKMPDKFNILEEQIDVNIQLEYFKQSKKTKKKLPKNFKIEDIELGQLENSETDIKTKKEIIIKIASIDDPKSYRILEELVKKKDADLHEWCVMALQENKMLLESSLLNENQVFISTGLGGKGTSLRYFVVLIGENISEFAEFQQKIVSSEFEYALKQNNSELENITFEENYVSINVLIPYDVPIQKVFRSAVQECNQYGGFIKKNFLVTNVKTLSIDEIKDFVEKNKLPKDTAPEIDFEPNFDDDE
ncbi:MAG: hypothetical protein JEZ09_08885 [Salinivirgaceae bacterium]|nr:hypothetical protein [Salinivirgaceae bacterium]